MSAYTDTVPCGAGPGYRRLAPLADPWWTTFLLIALAVSLGSPASLLAASVATFSPQGEVAKVRQVSARFADDMVNLGDPGAPSPFDVDCAAPGSGRWLGPRRWVYDFAGDLEAGVRCTFALRADLRSLAGTPVTGRSRFTFTTGGPRIVRSNPYEGALVDEAQVFVLHLNGAVRPESVERHAACVSEGQADRIPVEVVDGQTRDTLLSELGLRDARADPARLLMLRCRMRLPAGTRMTLVWGRGIESAGGVPTSRVQRLAFEVRPAFRVGLVCERSTASGPCVPLRPLEVTFSAPVRRDLAAAIRMQTPAGERFPDPYDRETGSTVDRVTFSPPLPPGAEVTLRLPDGFRDDAGRAPENASSWPQRLRLGDMPPLARFAARFGIIELADPVLPVTVRNIERSATLRSATPVRARSLRVEDDRRILEWLVRLRAAEADERASREKTLLRQAEGASTRSLPTPGTDRPAEVIGIPLDGAGLHVVEIESPRLGAALLGKAAPMYVHSAALVTNMAVHTKVSARNVAVWVTALDSGHPVASAQVRILACDGSALWSGRTDAAGIARSDGPVSFRGRCPEFSPPGLLVTARSGDDVSFALTSWNEGIEPWRFRLQTWQRDAGWVAHTVFDRTLVRAGETVSMKHLLRRETLEGLAFAPPESRPARLRITHVGSGEHVFLPLEWDGAGSARTRWPVPRAARLGEYAVALVPADGASRRPPPGDDALPSVLASGRFRVEAFRLPVMEGGVSAPGGLAVRPTDLPLDLRLGYIGGGPAAGKEVTVTALIHPRALQFADHDDYSFRPPRRDEESPSTAPRLVADKRKVTLGAGGEARVVLDDMPAVDRPVRLVAEMTYADPSGEIQTIATSVPLWPARVVAGIRVEDWARAGQRTRIRVVTLDPAGKPAPGTEVTVGARAYDHVSHRRRLVGGFYAYENRTEQRDLGEVCRGRSDADGRFTCEAALAESGSVELVARARDADGNSALSAATVWVAGAGEWWFGGENSDRIDVLPERRRYAPGETARFQVRTPFRHSTAWIAVEREGVVESFVTTLEGTDPVVSIPVRPGYAPNVYVSVLAVRGRIREAPWHSFFTRGWRQPRQWWHEHKTWRAPGAMVDLARPAYRFGVARIDVDTQAHVLGVQVRPDRTIYQTRETAQVSLRVTAPGGQPPPPGTSVAVAAVDEALLALMPNASWNVLEGMLRERAYGVQTATGQMQVVGKRHYGRKALAPGGGGGTGPTRELLDTLLYWNPDVAVAADGTASVSIRLNDALTRFRIVAVATGGAELFGTGSGTITATRDLQVIAGLPPLVREHDRFRASATLRNTTGAPISATISARIEGIPGALPGRTVDLPPGGSREVSWDVTVPPGVASLAWTLEARADGAATAADALRFVQRVITAVPASVTQAAVLQVAAKSELPVSAPAGAIPGRSEAHIALSPSVTAALDGVKAWFREYPYTCLEQRVSRTVALDDDDLWREIGEMLPRYLDPAGLARYFPSDRSTGSDVLTAYILSLAEASGRALPPTARERMLGGLTAFVEGRLRSEHWSPRPDLDVRKLAALDALARAGKARASQLQSIRTDPQDWPTSAVIDWISVLGRVPDVPNRAARIAQAEQILRARLDAGGTRLSFSTERNDGWWWLMVSPDLNAARLLALAIERPGFTDDLPLLAHGLIGRQTRGAWSTTTANAWGTVALRRYADKVESGPVGGTTRVQADPAKAGDAGAALDWRSRPEGGRLVLPLPDVPGRLSLVHEGSGAPWATVRHLAAVPLDAPIRSGYTISRSLIPVERRVPDAWSRGDIVRVRLDIDAQADMSWVVVSDPIPAGATVLGSGLGRDSAIATRNEEQAGRAWPAFQERGFDALRTYYAYAPKGRWRLEYTVRLNQDGRFVLPPTRVEAMYAPETHGAVPNPPIEIAP